MLNIKKYTDGYFGFTGTLHLHLEKKLSKQYQSCQEFNSEIFKYNILA